MKKFLSLAERVKSLDFYLLFFISCVTFLGLITLYSAAGAEFSPWADKQLLRFCLGSILMLAVALTDIRVWRSQSYTLYAISFVLLVFVEIKGHIGMGAQRWIDLKVFNLQPSELMKITLIMALAQYFHDKSTEQLNKLKTYVIPLLLIAAPSALVLRQPSLGTMVVFVASGAIVIYLAGIRLWKILVTLGFGLGSLPLLWMMMHTYQKQRILTFLDPESDPLGSGYNIMQSKISIGSGGFFGKGIFNGSQGQLQFLPEKQTDFIFALFTEEFGIMGATLLLIFYALIIISSMRISLECRNFYARIYGMGFTLLFFFHVFINCAMVMGLLPVVGVPLPFMSYGGTSMLSLLMGFGVLLSCYTHRSLRFGRSL